MKLRERIYTWVGVLALGGSASAACAIEPRDVDSSNPPAQYTVLSDITGTDRGKKTVYVRDQGRKRLDIREFTRDAIGVSIDFHNGYFFDGYNITSINYRSKRLHKWSDRSMRTRANGERWPDIQFGLESFLFGPVNESERTAVIAGYECSYWEYEKHDAEECITDWGASLHTIIAFPDDIGKVEHKAVKVVIGDGGPDTAFDFSEFKIIGE